MIDKEHIIEILKEKEYKVTHQRSAMIDVFLEHKDRFLSAEEIYQRSKEKYPQTNFSTIYRNLEIFEKLGILHKTSINEGAFHYELICEENHHHHIICKGCGKTEVIDFCPFQQANEQMKSKNFTLTDHKFELFGYCEKCKHPHPKI
ncbi:MAG: Fur family transcriptional regulator [Thermotaleaceae bacterium]